MVDKTSIDIALRAATDRGEVAGVVAMSASAAGTLYEGSFGTTDLATGAAMRPDAIFRLASMTKAITSVAAMQLVEQGRLALDAPIATVLPHLADRQVLAGFADDGTPRLRPAAGPVTLRQLLTHSAGYSYEFWNPAYTRMCQGLGIAPLPGSHDELARIPLLFDPGTAWNYGINTDIVGYAIEAATGLALGDYLRTEITEPLGMADTTWSLTEAQKPRVVGTHQRQPDGTLVPTNRPPPKGPGFLAGGGGLLGTAADYLRFLRMLLNGGMLDGRRILHTETVVAMGRNQLGSVPVTPMVSAMPMLSYDVDLFPGTVPGWTLGFLTNPEAGPHGRAKHSLAWAGMLNTYYWLDPAQDRAGVVMTQSFPFADPKALALLATLERGTYAAG